MTTGSVLDGTGTLIYSLQATDGTATINGTLTVTVQLVDVTPPSVPGSLTISQVSGGLELHWTASNDPESGVMNYFIYRSTTTGAETLYANVSGAATSYIDASVTAGTTYYYTISAINNQSLQSAPSPERFATMVTMRPKSRETLSCASTARSSNNSAAGLLAAFILAALVRKRR